MKIKNSIKVLVLVICTTAMVMAGAGCDKEPQPDQATSPPKGNESTISSTDPVPKTDDVTDTTEPKDEEPPVVVSTQEGGIVPLVGVGPINFGMSKEQVIAALGEPDVIEGGGIAMFYPKSKGLSFIFDLTKGVREISCWSQNHPRLRHKNI